MLYLRHDRSPAMPAGCSEAGLALQSCSGLKPGNQGLLVSLARLWTRLPGEGM